VNVASTVRYGVARRRRRARGGETYGCRRHSRVSVGQKDPDKLQFVGDCCPRNRLCADRFAVPHANRPAKLSEYRGEPHNLCIEPGVIRDVRVLLVRQPSGADTSGASVEQ
jgi:hypothetical protein